MDRTTKKPIMHLGHGQKEANIYKSTGEGWIVELFDCDFLPFTETAKFWVDAMQLSYNHLGTNKPEVIQS